MKKSLSALTRLFSAKPSRRKSCSARYQGQALPPEGAARGSAQQAPLKALAARYCAGQAQQGSAFRFAQPSTSHSSIDEDIAIVQGRRRAASQKSLTQLEQQSLMGARADMGVQFEIHQYADQNTHPINQGGLTGANATVPEVSTQLTSIGGTPIVSPFAVEAFSPHAFTNQSLSSSSSFSNAQSNSAPMVSPFSPAAFPTTTVSGVQGFSAQEEAAFSAPDSNRFYVEPFYEDSSHEESNHEESRHEIVNQAGLNQSQSSAALTDAPVSPWQEPLGVSDVSSVSSSQTHQPQAADFAWPEDPVDLNHPSLSNSSTPLNAQPMVADGDGIAAPSLQMAEEDEHWILQAQKDQPQQITEASRQSLDEGLAVAKDDFEQELAAILGTSPPPAAPKATDDFIAQAASAQAGQSDQASSPSGGQSSAETKPGEAQNEEAPPPHPNHDIFDQMGKGMSYANSFDLGSVNIHDRFDQFDAQMNQETQQAGSETLELTPPASLAPSTTETVTSMQSPFVDPMDLDDFDLVAELAQIGVDPAGADLIEKARLSSAHCATDQHNGVSQTETAPNDQGRTQPGNQEQVQNTNPAGDSVQETIQNTTQNTTPNTTQPVNQHPNDRQNMDQHTNKHSIRKTPPDSGQIDRHSNTQSHRQTDEQASAVDQPLELEPL